MNDLNIVLLQLAVNLINDALVRPGKNPVDVTDNAHVNVSVEHFIPARFKSEGQFGSGSTRAANHYGGDDAGSQKSLLFLVDLGDKVVDWTGGQ